MQPTDIQVQRSLAALEDGSHDSGNDDVPSPRDVPSGLVEELGAAPPLRPDRMLDARLRLEAGEEPTPDDLADRVVGRLVCDRLR